MIDIMTPQDRIHALPVWSGPITIEPLTGGTTNSNWRVTGPHGRAMVRLGDDIPLHGVLRFNELAASRAAHAAGLSPAVLHAEPGALVFAHIDGETLTPGTLRANLPRALDLVTRAHREIPRHIRGPVLAFWVFHVIRDYIARLEADRSPHLPLLPALARDAEALEQAVGPIELVFGHNDLLAANFMDDGSRLWLIDWDYAGFNSPLFDLGGLAAMNDLTPEQERFALETWYQRPADPDLLRRYRAMKSAARLRETLWSMVSEIHSSVDFDFASYTATNLASYRAKQATFTAR